MADMVCTSCGKPVQEGANFCIACGTPTSKANVGGKLIVAAEGNNGIVQLFEDEILIQRKGNPFWLKQQKGKSIPLSQIASVQFQPVHVLSSGHIQFLCAGQVPKKGQVQIQEDENSVVFFQKQQPAFERLKSAVEERIANDEAQQLEAHRDADMEQWMTQLRDGKVSVKFTIEGGSSEVLLKENEELRMMLPNMALWEARSVRTSTGGYGGPSFRVAKGVSFRLGAFRSQSSSHSDLKEIDRGRLTLTNQRLVFKGAKQTRDINLAKVVSVEPYKDGIAVQVGGHEKTQYFVGIDPTKMTITATVNQRAYPVPFTGLVLDCMIEGLVKKQEERRSQSSPKEIGHGAVHGHDIPEQIRELGKLRDSGLITAEEFEKKKKELLDRL